MATREEIVTALAKRRFNKYYWPNRSRANIRQSAAGLRDNEWDVILESLGNGNLSVVGAVIRDRLIAHLKAKAQQDIEDRLGQDDTLSITELEDLF